MGEIPKEPLLIEIGDQSFRVRVAPEERQRYLEIAKSVDATLRDILNGGVIGGPRALAMAAFQIAVELAEARAALRRTDQSRDRLGRLIDRIDTATDAET
ncbi:MAG: cell division protein ZapA [bacterium]|nr:cell division protein ZapA [bacterium]